MIFGKNKRNRFEEIFYSSLKIPLVIGLFATMYSCYNLEKLPNDIRIERIVLTKNDFDNGYASVDTVSIRRYKREDSSLKPLVGIKSFWKGKYIYTPYSFSEDAGEIWILPNSLYIDLSDKDIFNIDSTKEFVSKNFKTTLILGMNNEDYNIFIDEKTKIKIIRKFSMDK